MAAMTKATGADAVTNGETARISRGTVAGCRSDYRVRPEAARFETFERQSLGLGLPGVILRLL